MKLKDLKTVKERREAIEKETGVSLEHIGKFSLDETVASSRNCENMIGVAQIPLGVAGPLAIHSTYQLLATSYNLYLPLATTEGALVASVNRGCKAITASGGVTVFAERIGATRGPVFYTGSLRKSQELKGWITQHESQLKTTACETSSHLTLTQIEVRSLSTHVFVRFVFDTQDAMGMNMATIASQRLVEVISRETGIETLTVAGNFDIDKKPSWLNFINNRGFAVWAEAIIPGAVVSEVLKTTPERIQQVWLGKCVYGSIMSGSLGFNSQFANVVAALFLATGQDAAHVVEGSMGVTTTEILPSKRKTVNGKQLESSDLHISVYLPSLMVGTVGGGTALATQQEALKLLGIAGGNKGQNSVRMAEIVGSAVLAGELSLLASLSEGSLAKAHQMFRKAVKAQSTNI